MSWSGSHFGSAIDTVGSLVAIPFLSPLFLLVALLIKIVSPGPIIFRQDQVGYLGRVFTLWKFRTMHVINNTTVHREYLCELIHKEKEMIRHDNGNDPRIIPLGKLIRATGIGELHQLINVLPGDMSLVWPRSAFPKKPANTAPSILSASTPSRA